MGAAEKGIKKKPLMAKIANDHCEKIYITDDNPRNESPKKIRKELLKYIIKDKAFDIGNRSLAIKKLLIMQIPMRLYL